MKQAVLAPVEHLRQSGVGALPMQDAAAGREDEQLVAEATRAVQVLYERQRRIQDGAGVVAGLLGQGTGMGEQGSQQGSQGARRAGGAS